MADFSATDVAFTGIRFVREHPRTVTIWIGIQIVISLVLGGVAAVTMGPYMMQLQGLDHAGRSTDPAQVLALFGHMAPMYALFLIASLAIHSVIYATMARAVLEPGDEGFAYIRFGPDEARQCLLILLWILLAIGAEIVGLIAVLVPTLILSAFLPGLKVLIAVLCTMLVCAAGIYFLVRLSLASPLTYDSRRVDLFGSWSLTRGRFWKMLGTYLLVIGLALVIMVLTLIIAVAVAVVLGGMGAAASIFRPSAASMGAFFMPARLGVSLVWAVITPPLWALVFMPASAIYRQLRQA